MQGVSFEDKRSLADFGLVLTSRNIPLPQPKTYVVDIPGGDGQLDLSTSLTDGEVKYKNRQITMEFAVLKSKHAENVKSMIGNLLQGKTMKVIFDVDPNFYYYGRLTVTEFKTDKVPARVKMTLDADPYKYEITETVITKTATTSGITITVPEQYMKVVPVINVSANMTLTYKTKQIALLKGDNIIPEVQLSTGANNVLNIKGSGTVKITFRGGEL